MIKMPIFENLNYSEINAFYSKIDMYLTQQHQFGLFIKALRSDLMRKHVLNTSYERIKYNKQIQICKNPSDFNLRMSIDSEYDSSDLFQPKCFRTKQRVYNRWTLEQNQKYIAFLDMSKQDFDQEYTRRITKVFKRLSEFMETKTESQCKSHHQKMLQQYGNIENIISHFNQMITSQAKYPNSVSRKQEKQRIESRRKLKRVFKRLYQVIIQTEKKSIMRKIATVKLFSFLNKTMEHSTEIQEREPSFISRQISHTSHKDEEPQGDNMQNIQFCENQLFNVLNLDSMMFF